ncbi:MAG TPA: hypothetical protein VLL98_02320 [Rickettsiales bacterium]|nr:hypothetical protein [Rickettsiales bacterium]
MNNDKNKLYIVLIKNIVKNDKAINTIVNGISKTENKESSINHLINHFTYSKYNFILNVN